MTWASSRPIRSNRARRAVPDAGGSRCRTNRFRAARGEVQLRAWSGTAGRFLDPASGELARLLQAARAGAARDAG